MNIALNTLESHYENQAAANVYIWYFWCLISFYSDFLSITVSTSQTQISAELHFQSEDDVGLNANKH